mgnify:CR=1 FL=1
MKVSMTVNGTKQEHDVEPRTLLVQFIRQNAGLTGTNIGCDTSSCGACTLLIDGESVKSCTVLAAQADGADITTVQGLAAAVQGIQAQRVGSVCVRSLQEWAATSITPALGG